VPGTVCLHCQVEVTQSLLKRYSPGHSPARCRPGRMTLPNYYKYLPLPSLPSNQTSLFPCLRPCRFCLECLSSCPLSIAGHCQLLVPPLLPKNVSGPEHGHPSLALLTAICGPFLSARCRNTHLSPSSLQSLCGKSVFINWELPLPSAPAPVMSPLMLRDTQHLLM
jgi:hypothetical protein